jgi:hypothetical protein
MSSKEDKRWGVWRSALQKSAAGFLEAGLAALGLWEDKDTEEEFFDDCKRNLGMGSSRAKDYIKIGEAHTRLKKHVSSLPASFSAIHALAECSPHILDALAKDGVIRPGATANQIRAAIVKLEGAVPAAAVGAGAGSTKPEPEPESQVLALRRDAISVYDRMAVIEPRSWAEQKVLEEICEQGIETILALQKRLRASGLKAG